MDAEVVDSSLVKGYYLVYSRILEDRLPVMQTRLEYQPCINPTEVSANTGLSQKKNADVIISALFDASDARPKLVPNLYPTEKDLEIGGCLRDDSV